MPKGKRDLEYLRWVKTLPCLVCCPNRVCSWCGVNAAQSALHGEGAHCTWCVHYKATIPATGQRSPIEAAHMYNLQKPGGGAYGKKPDDRRAIPLCREHHTDGKDAAHKLGKRFAEHHGIDVEAEILRLNAEYEGVSP